MDRAGYSRALTNAGKTITKARKDENTEYGKKNTGAWLCAE
jgi:hypothetical protein